MTKAEYKEIKKELTPYQRKQVDEVLKEYGTDIQPNEDIINYLIAENVDADIVDKLEDY